MNYEEYKRRQKTVRTPFGEFAYVDVGTGDPAIFVHGLFVSSYLWRDVVEQLADDRRCIAYDLPAHGQTRVGRDQDLSLGANADMLAAFCDALGLDTVDVVANDTGGAIAQVFAVDNVDRVRTLTLTNCEARDVLPSPNEFAQLIATAAAKGELAPTAMRTLVDHDMARSDIGLGAGLQYPERLSADDIRGYVEGHYASLDNAREVERFFLALHRDQLIAIQPRLRRFAKPTLVVWGTGDPLFEIELAHWLRDTIPGCHEVVEVPGGKLFWPGERAEELVQPVRRLWHATA
jgi:pimeloyl-ACP methyl ester carboxylesterase